MKRTRWLAMAGVLAAVWFGAHVPAAVVDDSGTYLFPARSWASGAGLRERDGRPLENRLPLYPLLLGVSIRLFGDGPRVFTFLNLAAHAAAMLLVRRVVARHHEGAADAAFAAGLVYPPLLTSTALVLQESLLELTVAVVFVAAERALRAPSSRNAAVAGAWVGVAALAKTTALAMAPPLLILLGWGRHPSWRRSAAFLLGLALAVSPWAVRNRLVLGRWEMTNANGGHTVLGGTVSNEIHDWSAFPEYVEARRSWESLPREDRPALDRHLMRVALERIVADPARWLRLSGERALRFMLPARTWFVHVGWSRTGTLPPLYLLLTVFHVVLFAGTGVLAVRAVRTRSASLWAAPVIVFGHQLAYALTYASPRYAVSVGAVLFAGLALAALPDDHSVDAQPERRVA